MGEKTGSTPVPAIPRKKQKRNNNMGIVAYPIIGVFIGFWIIFGIANLWAKMR